METTTDHALQPPRARPKGRPSKDSIPPEAANARAFPDPPRSTIKNGTIPPDKFWAYAKALPDEFRLRLSFYVYREWPKLDVYRHYTEKMHSEIKAKLRKKPIKYIGQYPDIDASDWRNQLLRYHGSGVYKILLNDAGVRGNKAAGRENICSTIVEINDAEFLPVIEDLTILADDPVNASYLNELRLRGVTLPGDAPKEDTDDMANTIAVETLAKLAEQGSKPTPVDNGASAMLQEMLRASEARNKQDRELDAQRHQREIEALTKRLDVAEKAGGKDELATTRAVIEMAKSVMPPPSPPAPPPDNRMVDVLMQLLKTTEERALQERKLDAERHTRDMDMLGKRLEAQEARAAALEAARLAQPPTQGKTAIQEAISLVKALKGATEEINGDSGGGTGNPWVDLAAELGPRVLDTIGTVTTAIRGTPPPIANQGMPQQQQSGIVQQQAQPQQEDTSEMGQMTTYARMIRQPLIQCLSQNPPVPGHRFAGMLIVQYGDPAYHYLCQQGEPGVLAILQAAPEVWGDVQRFGARVPQFLQEFLDAPAAQEQAQMIRAGKQPGAPPQARTPRPVVVDSPPASEVPQTGGGGRTIISGEGKAVKTKVNGPPAGDAA